MEELLRYDHVDISYNGIPAVQDVSFTLRPGEILGIVGESGCGKSTLLKAAMGLLGSSGMVTRGDIWYKGRNLPDLPARALRKLNGPELGMIFQSAGSSFCPIRTVGAQLYEIMTQHGSATKRNLRTAHWSFSKSSALKTADVFCAAILLNCPAECSSVSALRRRCFCVPAFCLPMNRQPRWMFPCRNRF